jgi:hypothetical protein
LSRGVPLCPQIYNNNKYLIRCYCFGPPHTVPVCCALSPQFLGSDLGWLAPLSVLVQGWLPIREPNHPRERTWLQAIETAEELAARGLAHEQAIARLGHGWVADEALAISIYCALAARDFRHGVILAVNHDGDSDSTGSITGNLLGVMHGAEAIPVEWLEPLELRDVITEVADDLYAFKDWKIGEYAGDTELNERIWRKYPGF